MITIHDDPAPTTLRRICAALYYNQQNAQAVLDLLGGNRHRFVVRHDGLDVALIFAHAATSVRLAFRNNLILAAVTLLTFALQAAVIGSLWLVIPMTFGFAWLTLATRLMRWAYRQARHFNRSILATIIALVLFSPILIGFVYLTVIVGITMLIPGSVLFATSFWLAVRTQRGPCRKFRADAFTGQAPSLANLMVDNPFEDIYEEIKASTSSHDTTVYAGYSPFVGAGLGTWRWQQALTVASVDAVNRLGNWTDLSTAGQPVLHDLREAELTSQVLDVLAHRGLGGTTCRRWHLVHGDDAALIPGMVPVPGARPVANVADLSVAPKDVDSEKLRPYVWLTDVRWGGELVLNTFVRVHTLRSGLFVEIAHTVVPPLWKPYERADRDFDRLKSENLKLLLGDAVQNLLQLPANFWWHFRRRSRWKDTQEQVQYRIDQSLAVNYGAQQSVRELFSSPHYHHHFQEMDAEEHMQSVNTNLLDVIDEALRRFGYAIVNREAVIANVQNIEISNSSFQGKNVTIGHGNSSVTMSTQSSSGTPNTSNGHGLSNTPRPAPAS